ncbi:MAG: hypothetical protein FWB71_06260, partial [Defluviitaleaceae bacterium]|nr:hypothetical protein [Defluviitaleaceae bacterium]
MTTTKRMVFGRGYFVGEEAMEAGKIYGFEIVNERPAIEDAPLAANSIEPDPAQAFAEFVAPPAEVAEVEMAEAEVEIATPEIPEIAEAPE